MATESDRLVEVSQDATVEYAAADTEQTVGRVLRVCGGEGSALDPDPVEDLYEQTAGACVCHPGFEGVCPVDWCRFHLDSQERKTWKDMPERRPDGADTCAVRISNQGGHTLEEVAVMLGLTRERVRQIEEKALGKMTRGFIRRQLYGRSDVRSDRTFFLKISRDDPPRGSRGEPT